MTFSIIIPVYKNEETIERCLESVFIQSFSDWEIIVIDDGSMDNTCEILQRYALREPRINIVKQDNRGPGEARNLGMSLARGEYIIFLDGDDKWIGEDSLELINTAIKYNHPCVLGTLVRIIDMYGNSIEHSIHRDFLEPSQYASGMGKWIEFEQEQNAYCFWSYIYSKKFLMQEKIWFPNFRRFQDPVFLTQVLHAAKKYYLLPIEFYCNIWHESEGFNVKQRQDLYRAQNWLMNYAKIHKYDKIVNELRNKLVPLEIQNATDVYLREEWLAAGFRGEHYEITMDYIYKFWKQNYRHFFFLECNVADRVIIYGAGGKGKEALEFIKQYDSQIMDKVFFAITCIQGEEEFCGIPVVSIYDLKDMAFNDLILVARQKEYQQEMIEVVKELGWHFCYCWSDELKVLRKTF